MLENNHEFGEILLIDTDPEANVVASPDGRIFVNVTPWVAEMTLELLRVRAENPDNSKMQDEITGAVYILKHLMESNIALREYSVLQKAGLTGGKNEFPSEGD